MPEVIEDSRPDEADHEPSQESVPELAFTDAASATRWMNGLPLSNVGMAYEALLGQLHALTHSEIGPRDRATIAEVAREPVAHLHATSAKPRRPIRRSRCGRRCGSSTRCACGRCSKAVPSSRA